MRGALFNDSKFLADVNVMDYSLVVGVDTTRNELVMGIVGQQRTGIASCRYLMLCRLHQDIYMG